MFVLKSQEMISLLQKKQAAMPAHTAGDGAVAAGSKKKGGKRQIIKLSDISPFDHGTHTASIRHFFEPHGLLPLSSWE